MTEKKHKNTKEQTKPETKTQEQNLEDSIKKLEQEKREIENTAKRAQFDYINLRMDFDRLQKQVDEKEKSMKIEILIENVRKFLPFVEELRKSLETLPEEQKSLPLAKGLELTYNKFLKTLESMSITPIESIWLEPDSFLHEPVSTAPTEDPKIKWKIIKEFEKWFVFKKDWETKIITTSKVVIWQ